MDAILQTMTLAVILLIIGLTCLLIGVSALMWSTGRDRRRIDKAASHGAHSSETADDVLHQPTT